MTYLSALLVFALITTTGHAAEWLVPTDLQKLSGTDEEKLIPNGWALKDNGRASGDLDGDGKQDLVLVVQKDTGSADGDPPILVLFFKGDAKRNFTYFKSSDRLIVPRSEGGRFEPFQGVNVKKKVVTFDFFGSVGAIGNERWILTCKYRLQKGEFHLIGKKTERIMLPSPDVTESEDTNYSTGEVIVGSGIGKPVRSKEKRSPISITNSDFSCR